MLFSPFTFIIIVLFFFFLIFLFVTVQINVIALVFTEIGIPPRYVFSALFATLFGSFINIPVKKIPQESITDQTRISFRGMRYVVPTPRKKETIIAINLGGAIIPAILSAYLLVKTGLWFKAGLATALMAFVTYRLARPVPGLGIALPFFIPPALAAIASVVIAYEQAPVVAYVSGTVGTLIGADIFHLEKIGKLGAPVASIGGAGTFDGIFLNGILAVLLAAWLA